MFMNIVEGTVKILERTDHHGGSSQRIQKVESLDLIKEVTFFHR